MRQLSGWQSCGATSLVVCSTCRFSAGQRDGENGQRGGAIFAELLNGELLKHPLQGCLELQSMPCLFACSQHCSVYLRSARRFGYLLSRFEPSPGHARALLDYVALYLETSDGILPYARWPAGIKGHFLARVPPDGLVWTEAS
jgi:predicted metal-binding protein